MRGMAMVVFGMGVVMAPIVGPTLGGWITDNYSWQSVSSTSTFPRASWQ